MPNPTLIKNYKAGAAIAAARIVKWGANDGEVIQGAAATDFLQGVCCQPGGAASGDRCDVALAGIATVEAGGAITRGGPVTSDANGKAVAAAPGAGSNNRLIGYAMVTAANGDLFDLLLAQSSMQG